MSRVLVVGHACVDLIARLERVPGSDEKLEAEEAWLGGGGPGANAAVMLRRLAHDVRMVAAIGDDAAGAVVEDGLRAEGVELLLPRSPGTTSIAQIQVVAAERSVAWKRGTVESVVPDGATAERWLADVDLLYLDGHELDTANAVLRAAVAAGTPVIADLGTLRPGTEAWLEHLVWAVATPRFAAALSGTDDPDAGLRELERRAPDALGVGITLGARGGIARIDGRTSTWGRRKVRQVDSTAAGDAFHAGLADAFLHDLDPWTSIQWASAVGASVVRGLGGRLMLPRDRDRMQQFERAWPELPPDA